MSIDVEQFFDSETLAALRGLKRDRTLTIVAGARSWVDPELDIPAAFVVCLDPETNQVLTASPTLQDEQDEAIVGLLLKAMLSPDGRAAPRLPRRVIVEDPDLAKAIERPLSRLNVQVVVEATPAIDTAIDAIRKFVADMPLWYVDRAKALPLYQAAAAIWAAEPWDMLWGEGASATITMDAPINQTLHLVSGVAEDDEHPTMMFFLSAADFLQLQSGEDAELDESTAPSTLTLMFQDFDDTEDDEVQRISEQRLPIGSGSAFPRFMRTGVEGGIRQMNDDEAHWLTIAMDAVARFCLNERLQLQEEEGDDPISAALLVQDGDDLVQVQIVTPAIAA
jgi:hypothetical protein